MNGLTLEQEAALTISWMHQNDETLNFTTFGMGKAFRDLKRLDMIQIATDMSGNITFLNMLSKGAEHYDRARQVRGQIKQVGDDDDELIMRLATEDKHMRMEGLEPILPTSYAGAALYEELAKAGLIEIMRYDHGNPWVVHITDEGKYYAEGRPQGKMGSEMPDGDTPTVAAASAGTLATICKKTFVHIDGLDIDGSRKEDAKKAMAALSAAAIARSELAFAEKLESLADVAKSSADLATILLSFAKSAYEAMVS